MESKTPNLLVRLWRGDVRLVITFWVFGVLMSAIVGIPLGILSATLRSPWLVYVIAFPIIIFQSVSIWRSANKYQGQVSIMKLAKISVFLGVFFSALDLLLFILNSGKHV